MGSADGEVASRRLVESKAGVYCGKCLRPGANQTKVKRQREGRRAPAPSRLEQQLA